MASIIFPQETIQRFWDKVVKTNECWIWNGSKSTSGHGTLRCNGKGIGAHVFSWSLVHGMRPNDCILHKCDNPPCVNPSHLYHGSKKDNARDAVTRNRHFEARKTYCDFGHPFNKENTLIVFNGARRCRICNKVRCKNYYQKIKTIKERKQ